MNNYNGFGLLIDVVFDMIPQLEGLGPKPQDLVISYCLVEGETLPKFHLRSLHIRSEMFLLQDETRKKQQPHR